MIMVWLLAGLVVEAVFAGPVEVVLVGLVEAVVLVAVAPAAASDWADLDRLAQG